MKEIVEKIIKAESNAQNELEKIKEKSEKIRKDADKKFENIINKAIEDAKKESIDLLEKTKEEAKKIKEKELKASEAKNEFNISEPKLNKIADNIIKKYILSE